MKSIVIIISVLFVATIVYGAINTERLKKFNTNLGQCIKEKGGTLSAPTPEALVCAVEMDGMLVLPTGEYIREEHIKAIGEVISDPGKAKEAQAIYAKCHDEADKSKVTGHEQALKIAACTIPVLKYFDKL